MPDPQYSQIVIVRITHPDHAVTKGLANEIASQLRRNLSNWRIVADHRPEFNVLQFGSDELDRTITRMKSEGASC